VNPTALGTAAGGLGVFIFSLRYLNSILQRSIARRLGTSIQRLVASPIRGFILGALVTVLVQASSITIVAAMGLVSSHLIELEEAWFVMLGATVGTTVKAWVFARGTAYAPAILALALTLRWSSRKAVRRELADVLLAIGLCFLGLELLSKGLAPVLQEPWVHTLLTSQTGRLTPLLVGCGLAVVAQSSSALVILTIELARQGGLFFDVGAALILGMNIGTTSTELLASTEAVGEGRLLAIGHCFIKSVGAVTALLALPLFHTPANAGFSLAALHTGFNLLNAIAWSVLARPTLSLLRRLRAGSAPRVASLEAELTMLLERVQNLQNRYATALRSPGHWPEPDTAFATAAEALSEAIFVQVRRDAHPSRWDAALRMLGACELLHREWELLREAMEAMDLEGAQACHPVLAPGIESLLGRWDEQWTAIFKNQSRSRQGVVDLCGPIMGWCRGHRLDATTGAWLVAVAIRLTAIDYAMTTLAESAAQPRPVALEEVASPLASCPALDTGT
jgi:Na/Pi-cotransporter